jgi:hypothetical protein
LKNIQRKEGAEPLSEPMSCVIIWSGSDAAKKYGGKGWLRSEAEWEGRVEETLTKEAGWTGSEKMDSKFRTRLCTNWMRSGGAGCAMLKKGKCVFAHSPCELRVKEGKRQRWGTLVNADGESSNPRASGGEDTFSPAMDVEQQRLEEGKWEGKGRGGGRGRGGGGGRGGGRGGPGGRGRGRGRGERRAGRRPAN